MTFLSFELKQMLLFFSRFLMVTLKGGEECLVCGGFSSCLPLCSKCVSSFYDVKINLGKQRCRKCGKVLISENELCMECRKETVFIHTDEVIPLFGYRLWNKEVLFKWKIMGIRSFSPFFASCIHNALKEKNISFVVPVPPRKGKIQKKGWDQIDEICQFLEYRYKYKVLRILQRNETTDAQREQKKLDRTQRLENIGKSYSMLPEKKLMKQLKKTGGVLPDSCCLIDDILTTGSTAESCALVLKEGGIKRVDVMALFTAG